MDYRQIYFLYCTEKDYYNILDQVCHLKSNKITNPVLFHTFNDEEHSMPFVLGDSAHYEVGDRYYTKRSAYDCYQLIYTCSGCGIIETNNRRFECISGTAILIDCRSHHSYHVPKGKFWEYKHIHFKVEQCARRVADKATGYLIMGENGIERIMDDIFHEVRNFNTNTPYLLNNYISNMLTELIIFQTQEPKIHPHRKLIEKMAKYMREHYSEKVNINDMAKDEFISVFYFTRLFKEYYGTSPYDYLVKYRINKAKGMLVEGYPVKVIAQNCGFGNTNNFSRIFKKHNHLSPDQFRRKYYTSSS